MNIIKWIKGLILITRQCYKECLAHEKHLEYNKTLDILYRNCVSISKQYNSENKIHLTYIRKQIDLIQKEL